MCVQSTYRALWVHMHPSCTCALWFTCTPCVCWSKCFVPALNPQLSKNIYFPCDTPPSAITSPELMDVSYGGPQLFSLALSWLSFDCRNSSYTLLVINAKGDSAPPVSVPPASLTVQIPSSRVFMNTPAVVDAITTLYDISVFVEGPGGFLTVLHSTLLTLTHRKL